MKNTLFALALLCGLFTAPESRAAICRNGNLVGWTGPVSPPCGEGSSQAVHACGTASIWSVSPDRLADAAETDMRAVAVNLCAGLAPVQVSNTAVRTLPGQAYACADFECR